MSGREPEGGFVPGNPGGVRPRIGSGESAVEPIVMQAEYQLPWQRESSQTACGQTIQNQNGDLGWRVVLEGIMSASDLIQLNALRDQEEVLVTTEEFGQVPVAFDNLTVTRADDEKWGEIEGEHSPILQFQLQTKESSDEEGEGVQFFNENTRGTNYPGG